MKIVLKSNVPNLGLKGEIKVVSDGYFRNFLGPKGFAVMATEIAIKGGEEKRRQELLKMERTQKESKEIKSKLEGLTLEITKKVSSGSKLYGSVTEKDLLSLIKVETSIDLPRNCVSLGKGLKEVGEHSVEIKLTEALSASIKLVIKGE